MEITHISKFKPKILEKNSSSIGPQAESEHRGDIFAMSVQCSYIDLSYGATSVEELSGKGSGIVEAKVRFLPERRKTYS